MDFQCEIHVVLQSCFNVAALTTPTNHFRGPGCVPTGSIDFESSFRTCFHPIGICQVKGKFHETFAPVFSASETQPPDIQTSKRVARGGVSRGDMPGMPSDTTCTRHRKLEHLTGRLVERKVQVVSCRFICHRRMDSC